MIFAVFDPSVTVNSVYKLQFLQRAAMLALLAVLAIAITSVCPSLRLSVCLSVRLTHAGIVSKRRHVARYSLHCRIAKCV